MGIVTGKDPMHQEKRSLDAFGMGHIQVVSLDF